MIAIDVIFVTIGILFFCFLCIRKSLIYPKIMKKLHKYIGLFLIPLFIWMGISGIILNHRKAFSTMDVSRKWLPEAYLYQNWNRGFFKGGLPLSPDSLLLYGNEGIWLSDGKEKLWEYNDGLAKGADQQKIHRLVQAASGQVYAASSYTVYVLSGQNTHSLWHPVSLPDHEGFITDMEVKGDTLVVLTRSVYMMAPVRKDDVGKSPEFQVYQLPDSLGQERRRSLFRVIWDLHCGALWGITGRVVVDILAVLLSFISITGLLVWWFPKQIRRKKRLRKNTDLSICRFKWNFIWHDKVGYWLLIPLFMLIMTGAFLRPPLLILIAREKVSPPPLTVMNGDNSWHELLRSLRYDSEKQEWLLYTSEGFFSLKELGKGNSADFIPNPLRNEPPVSVMGLNVWQQLDKQKWLVGSFQGLYVWDRETGLSIDALTGLPPVPSPIPVGKKQISGFLFFNPQKTLVFDYNTGVEVIEPGQSFITMPEHEKYRSMSWWSIALEMHTGRMFTFLKDTSILFPFFMGLLGLLVLYSGWKISRRSIFKSRNKK